MGWNLVEDATITSDCSPDPPIEQGNQAAANLFYWSGIIARLCVIVRRLDNSYLELWARSPGGAAEWELLSTSPGAWAGDHYIMAVEDTDGAIVLAVHSVGAGGYRFGRLEYTGSFVWTETYPGLDGSYFLVEADSVPMMCAGTSGDIRPRLLGKFWGGASYSFCSATFNPAGGGNGLAIQACACPPNRSYFSMDLDVIRDVIVIFGGDTDPGNLVLVNDVWEGTGLTGTDYAEVPWTGDGPAARMGAAMCYVYFSGMLIYGGVGSDGYLGRGGWVWNGTIWTRSMALEVEYSDPDRGGMDNSHFFRSKARLAYDTARRVPTLFRGVQQE